MQSHPDATRTAARIGAAVAGRDPRRLASALAGTVRLRALLPGGPIQAVGRENVAACLHALLADFDTVQLVESAGEPVADRVLIHYRLHVSRGSARWVCTQTAVCTTDGDRLVRLDLLCSGFRALRDGAAQRSSFARRVLADTSRPGGDGSPDGPGGQPSASGAGPTIPSRRAAATARAREGSCSLRSTADT